MTSKRENLVKYHVVYCTCLTMLHCYSTIDFYFCASAWDDEILRFCDSEHIPNKFNVLLIYFQIYSCKVVTFSCKIWADSLSRCSMSSFPFSRRLAISCKIIDVTFVLIYCSSSQTLARVPLVVCELSCDNTFPCGTI